MAEAATRNFVIISRACTVLMFDSTYMPGASPEGQTEGRELVYHVIIRTRSEGDRPLIFLLHGDVQEK